MRERRQFLKEGLVFCQEPLKTSQEVGVRIHVDASVIPVHNEALIGEPL